MALARATLEHLENPHLLLRRDTGTGVTHGDAQGIALTRGFDRDLPSLGELERVRREILYVDRARRGLKPAAH